MSDNYPSGADPEKETGSEYKQPFSPVQDSSPRSQDRSLGMREMGPNQSPPDRKANTNQEQVVPQSTVIHGNGGPVLNNILNSGKQFHEDGDDSTMDDDK